MPDVIVPNREISEIVAEMGGVDAFKCYVCGKCLNVCPWNFLEAVEYKIYRIPQTIRLGAILSSEDKSEVERDVEEVFRCVSCEACRAVCPRSVNLADIFTAMRRILVDYGSMPRTLKAPISKIYNQGNPLGSPREVRGQWADGLDVKAFEPGMEYLYFPCCIPAYDARGQNIARSTALILQRAGVSFGILGEAESCCCEAIRRAGAENLFIETARSNIETFKKAGVTRVLTTSPHCYAVFRNEYPKLGAEFEVVHVTQLLHKLIAEGKLTLGKPVEKRVVYHDPCTLGRQNSVYDEPREVLKSIPGIELLEVTNFSREYSICCGGGGGGLWLDRPKGERLSDLRVRQLSDTGADVIAVACPYCLQMFEDSVKTMDLNLEVKDISELVIEALE